jgi:hypothetical protein
MAMSGPKQVSVKYSVVNGAHFFTGADLFSQGLCVAHKDLKTAYSEVAVQLKNLAEINHSVHAEFTPAMPVQDFQSYLQKAPPEPKVKPTIEFELEAA